MCVCVGDRFSRSLTFNDVWTLPLDTMYNFDLPGDARKAHDIAQLAIDLVSGEKQFPDPQLR